MVPFFPSASIYFHIVSAWVWSPSEADSGLRFQLQVDYLEGDPRNHISVKESQGEKEEATTGYGIKQSLLCCQFSNLYIQVTFQVLDPSFSSVQSLSRVQLFATP